MTTPTPPVPVPPRDHRVVNISADAIERDVARLTNLVKWIVALTVVNVLMTLYVAEFVRHIEQAIHQL